jgi:hypothetical protein
MLELPDARVELANARERCLGLGGVARLERLGDAAERAAQLAEDRLDRAADEQNGILGEGECADRKRDATADQRLENASGQHTAAGRLDENQQDRRDRGLGDEDRAAAEHHRHAHREHNQQPELPRPGADQLDEQVGHADPEHDPSD